MNRFFVEYEVISKTKKDSNILIERIILILITITHNEEILIEDSFILFESKLLRVVKVIEN